jgi:phosphoenolpyruvate-protein kinase (PTS system EI component)
MLVDAEAGTVTVAPTKREALRFAARKNRYTTPARGTALGPAQSCTTKDGVRIWLNANIDRADEAHLVLEYRLDGVGLFRSEFLFLDAESPPNLETQSAAYSGVAQMLSPLPVVIRTMDLGGDKIPRFKRSADDMALRMGKRGLAYSLTEKTMFRTQLQAILQAAQGGNVKIMFPMVMSAADLSDACRLVEELAETEQLAERPPIGAMIETPAAVFDIRGILEIVDFVSIGTNDLTHSILAMDRGSQGSPGVLSFLHPGVLRAMEQVVRAAIGQRVPLSVCGEAANDPVAACILVGMGVRNFSMSPFLAARVGHAIRQLTFAQAQNAARDALDTKTPEDVQEIVASALRDIYPEGHERGEVIA